MRAVLWHACLRKTRWKGGVLTGIYRPPGIAGNLLVEEVPLEGAEELFGLGQGQPEMLDALMVLVEGDDIGDGLFLTLIVTHDELQFDTHTGASPGSSDGSIAQAILPEY